MLVIMLEIMVMIMLKIMLVSSSQVAYSGGRRLRRWTALREWLRSTNVVLVEWLSASLKVYQREKTRPVEIVKLSTRKKFYFYRCWMPSSTCSRHWDNVFPGGTLNILDIFQLRKCVHIPLFLASTQNDQSFQHLLDQAEGATGVDPDLILDTVALCHDSHQAVLDRFSKPFTRFSDQRVFWKGVERN